MHREGEGGHHASGPCRNTLRAHTCVYFRGEIYVSDKMLTKLLGRFVLDSPDTGASTLERLSNRELEVFQLIGEGHSTRPIAAALHVSIKTVESHRAHIKEKLQLNDTVELVRYALQWVDNGHFGST